MYRPSDKARILRTSDLTELGLGSRTTQHRKIKKGLLPPPDFYDGQNGWFESSIIKNNERLAALNTSGPKRKAGPGRPARERAA